MERNFTNLAENQSATKAQNRRRTTSFGRQARVMLFTLVLFVGMGKAWGQSTTPTETSCVKVTFVNGNTTTVTYYDRLTTANSVTGALNAVGDVAAGTAGTRKVFTIELLWPDTDSRLTNQYTVDNMTTFSTGYKDITIKTADEVGSPATIKRGSGMTGNVTMLAQAIASGSLTLENIIIDGMNIACTGSGAVLRVSAGTLNINSGTIVQNGKTSGTSATYGNGGLVSATGGTLNINNATLQNGTASFNGGLVYANAATVNIDGATLQNGTASTGAIISKAGTGALNITNSVINGSSATSTLIDISGGSGAVNIMGTTLNGQSATGSLISKAGTGALNIGEASSPVIINGGSATSALIDNTGNGDVTIKNTTIDGENATGSIISKAGTGALNIGEAGSPVTINGGSSPSTLINITAGATTMTNAIINGQSATGTLISNSGTGAMTFTDCAINGSTTAASNTLVSKSNTGATTFTNTTITRNQSKGYGFVNSSSGVVTFDGCTIDGSNNLAATNSLIKMGTGALTLNNTTVSGHTVSTADVCAVDATAGTANVNVSGTTNIADNTSASLPANLAVNGTNRLKIGYDASHNSLTGTIGVTTPKIENEQFAILGNAAYTGHEYLMNDKDEDFYAEVVSNTNLYWRSSATPCFYIGTTTYTTLKAAVNQAATNTTIYSCTNEYTMKEPVNMGSKVITIQPGNALDENGQPNGESIERLILNRGARATGDLITTGAALTLNNITLDGGEVEATGSFIKVTAGALTLNNVTINGGKTTANLIHDTGAAAMTITDSEINGSTVANSGNLVYKQVNAASGAVTFTNTTFNGNEVTGDLISLSNTGSNRTMNVIFDNCTVNGAANGSGSLVSKATNGTFSATNGSAFYGNGSTGTLINLSNSTGNTNFSNATISGGTSTGDLLSDAGTGTLSFTDCSVNGSTVAADNALVKKSNTGAVTFTNTTVTRNQSKGYGFINSSSGAVTFNNCIIDGSGNTSATASLIKSGTGNLTLTNTMVTGHNVSATGVCAVDATSVSGKIDVSGETSITGNTSNGDPANLKASGTNILRIPAASELSLTVGVTSTDNYSEGNQFAVRGDGNSLGYQYFQNDKNTELFGKKSGNNTIIWGKYNQPSGVFRIFVAADDDYYYFEDLKSAIEKSNQLSVNTTIRALTPVYTAIATDAVAFTANHNVTILPDDESASFTLKRGEVTGDLLTFASGPSGKTLTLINTTLDGEANDGVVTTGSLIKMGGTNILTLNNSSVINNTASSSGVCGIDASGSTGKVNLVGNVNVKDNTADGANANLKVNGTTRLTLTGNLTGQEVGVTTPQGIGTQFAYGSSSYTGYETLINDAEANVRPYYNSATAIYWRYTYLGLVYTFTGTGESTKAKVSNFDLTYTGGIPTVADTIPYNGYDVPVTDLTYFGSAATLKYKNLFFSESMLNKMANGAVIGLPDIVAHFNEAISEAVEGYITGVNNANSQGAKNVWKKAEYNPETNQIEYTLKYLQLMTQDQPLDFVFSIDQTSTMCTADATAYDITAPRVIWMMALLQKTAYELVSRNGDGYINQVAFIPWGTSATKSEFMDTNEEITEWFSGRDAYSHVEEGTNHSKPAQACVEMAHASLDAGRIPVIIYMSDFQANAHSNRNNAYVRELRQTTDYKTYAINIFADASAYGEYYQNSGVYFADEPAEFMEAFTMIIKDAIGYYLNKPLVVEDGMSTPLAGMTPTEGSADGQLDATAGQANWILGEQDPLLFAGELYTTTFTVLLEDDAVYSGAMPTNGVLIVKHNNEEVNRIDNSPIISKPVTLVLKSNNTSGSPIAGVPFTLKHGDNTWNLTTDANGQIVLPWGENDLVGATTAESTFAFKPDAVYTLTQTTTLPGYISPSGAWTLTVGADYKITTSGATPAIEAHAGKLEIYNEAMKIARVSNDNGATWTYHEYLINSSGTGSAQGAFNKANSLTGNVLIETLLETAIIGSEDRYILTEGFTFNGANLTGLTLQTTQDDAWNPATGEPAARFRSTITKNQTSASMIKVNSSVGILNVENLVFDGGGDNGYSATEGGLFYVASNDATFTDCDFVHSKVSGNKCGGAISYQNNNQNTGTVRLYGCVFNDCQTTTGANPGEGNGGAFYIGKGKDVIVSQSATRRSSFTGCVAKRYGGAVEFEDNLGSTLLVEYTDFISCSASEKSGGAVYSDAKSTAVASATTIDNCTFNGCTANSQYGGAIVTNIDTKTFDVTNTVSNCTFTDCSAYNGGAIYSNSTSNATLSITNCSITDCSASNQGGGIFLTSGANLTVSGLVVVDNNMKGTALNNVYLDDARNKYVTIDAAGLACGSHIGIYKTTGYTADANAVQQTVIAQGAGTETTPATNCQNAFSNGYFFDDRGLYGVYNLSYGATYTNDKLYFIDTWEGQASTAAAGTDYVLSGDCVAEVKTAKGLAYFAKDVNNGKNYSGQNVVLSNDIDLGGHYWVPIGLKAGTVLCDASITTDAPFGGIFNGQGHIISNMKSILPYKAMGLFGFVQSGTITNTFIENGIFAATCSDDVTMGGLVGMMDNGNISYSEVRVNMTNNTNTNCYIGGLVGRMDNNTIHSSMAIPEMTNGTMMGGLVGKMDQGNIKNSFANPKFNIDGGMTTWTVGGLAGSIVETEIDNCYVLKRGTVPTADTGKEFGWLAGNVDESTVRHCYIPDGYSNYFGEGDDETSGSGTYTPTALVNNKYGYNHTDQDGHFDQLVGETPLVDLLNTQAVALGTQYARWTRTMASPMNGDYPVLMLPGSVCITSSDNVFLEYHPELNEQIVALNATTGGGNVFLYDTNPEVIDEDTDDDVRVYIHENVGILQEAGNELNARVGVTFDNSSNNMLGGAKYDWHMFSTPLKDAPLGIDYTNTPAGGLGFGNPVTDAHIALTATGYYPTNTDFNGFDFYCYHEPSCHWINFKRNTGDHWHQATGNKIDYTNLPNLVQGKGYMMAIDKETMLMADGKLTNDADAETGINANVTYTTTDDPYDAVLMGINLIGNPYQSYLDFDEFAKDNGKNNGLILDKSYYIMDADNDGYIVYPLQSSTNPMYAPRFIHPHQGFLVAVPSGTTQLTFTNDMRCATGNEHSYFRGEQIDYPLVNLICTDANGKRDFTTVEIDRPEQGGARKLMNMRAGDASLYAHFNNQGYQALYAPQGVREVPVRLEVFEDGVFTMTWSMFHGDFGYVHLIDNLTGADIDMLSNDSYRFEASTDDYASRFRLVFDVTGIEEYDDDDQNGASAGSGAFAFFDGNSWVVTGQGTLQLFDVNGRCLMSTNVEGTQSSVTLPKVASGVYMLRLTNGNGTRVQKVVVR